QDWFCTLPSASIRNFKKLARIFTKEYTSYKMVRKHADHLFNLRKKPNESLRDYLRRFKAEKANIIGCNHQVASLAFKKGLPTEHELYRELAITPSQTLAKVFETAERYALWNNDHIAAKKASKQVDHLIKQ
ncbi:PREDICTED: VITISV_027903, partial [Prunus dulcis]